MTSLTISLKYFKVALGAIRIPNVLATLGNTIYIANVSITLRRLGDVNVLAFFIKSLSCSEKEFAETPKTAYQITVRVVIINKF